MTNAKIEAMFDDIVKCTPIDQVYEIVDELMPEYLSDDWDTEFDDICEAYEEQGRGQAEDQAIVNIMGNFMVGDLSEEERFELHRMLTENYEL